MWLAKQRASAEKTAAELGTVTIAGEYAGVMSRGEVRSLPVFAPGGCVWMPEDGDTVLVLKGGPGGMEQCVAGKRQDAVPEGMRPGEVLFRVGDASVWLRQDGSILLNGNVNVQGSLTINGVPCTGTEK